MWINPLLKIVPNKCTKKILRDRRTHCWFWFSYEQAKDQNSPLNLLKKDKHTEKSHILIQQQSFCRVGGLCPDSCLFLGVCVYILVCVSCSWRSVEDAQAAISISPCSHYYQKWELQLLGLSHTLTYGSGFCYKLTRDNNIPVNYSGLCVCVCGGCSGVEESVGGLCASPDALLVLTFLCVQCWHQRRTPEAVAGLTASDVSTSAGLLRPLWPSASV